MGVKRQLSDREVLPIDVHGGVRAFDAGTWVEEVLVPVDVSTFVQCPPAGPGAPVKDAPTVASTVKKPPPKKPDAATEPFSDEPADGVIEDLEPGDVGATVETPVVTDDDPVEAETGEAVGHEVVKKPPAKKPPAKKPAAAKK